MTRLGTMFALIAAGVLAASAPALAQDRPAAAPVEQAPVEQAPGAATQPGALPPAEEVKATDPGQPPAAAQPEPRATAPAGVPAVDATRLPHDLSPLGMFLNADWVVKTVMVGLAIASLLTWTIWLAKSLELMAARRRAKAALAALAAARSLDDARRAIAGDAGPIASFVAAADAELSYSADALSPEGVKERVASHLDRLEAQAGRKLTVGTGLLATTGAIAPFVGLFGTVWGIMNSFIGISNAQTTNLAVVAPGIAEALLATAIGLVAAIPAVMIYNIFARAIAGHRALLADASAAVLRLVSRDLDRMTHPRLARAAE